MASKAQAKKTYQHFVPVAKPVPNWYENYNFVLIENMQQLEQSFTDAGWTPGKSFMSFDTETTGLNFEELDLVGYSYCIDGKSTYYVPVDHFECPINLGEPAVEFIYQRMCEARQVFMYNARYDMRVFEYRGYKDYKARLDKIRWLYAKFDMSKVNVFDVMNAVFDSDSNDKLPSLKGSALHFLGYDMMHFDEVIAEAGNFYYLNPKNNFDAVYYAASDALCTYLLAIATLKYYQEAGMAGKLDNMVIYPLMHYESEKLWLDKEKLRTMYDECVKEVDRLEHEVYSSFGYQINLNSPVQVAQALERLGIDTGERTASGNMATGMHVLENLPQDLRDKFPALDAFLKYKEVNKLLTSYFKVYLKEAESKGYIRANYKLHGVPTGRLASGKDGKNTYFSPTNIQAVPKPHVAMYDVFDLGSAYRNFFSKKNNIIMGYVFSPAKYDESKKHIVPDDPRYIGWAEGMNPYLNIRSCVTGKMYEDSKDDEWVLAAVDYCIDPNTLVELENGNIVKLCDLKEGQKIKTPYGFYPVHNFHYTGKKQKCILAMRSGKFVICSPDHKFMVKEYNTIVWKTLSELNTRDNIVTYNTNTYEDTIDYIKITNEYINMCDIEVEEVHCYYANGIVTHNCAQELRITANLSHEPTWENAFVEGRDVHKSCYSLDTEFLTKDMGFVTYDKIGFNTLIAQYNPDTEYIEWVPAGHKFFNKTKTMYHFKGNNTDLLVTPNHRMYSRGRDNWYIYRADKMYHKRFYDTICSPKIPNENASPDTICVNGGDGCKSFSFSTEDFCEMMGYILTDGGTYHDKQNHYRVYIGQSDAKLDVLEKIQNLNQRLGNIFREDVQKIKGIPGQINDNGRIVNFMTNGDLHTFEVIGKALYNYIVDNFGGPLKKDRYLPTWFKDLDNKYLQKFVDAALDGDGCHDNREGRTCIDISFQSKQMANDFQYILIKLGYSTNLHDYSSIRGDGYRLEGVPNKRVVSCENRLTDIVEYEEEVTSVCFAVPSGLLVVRHNGKVSVCGNTAEIVWGKENYNKDYRKMAKGVNFCSCINNRILVKNKGYIKAKDLKVGDSLVSGLDFNASNNVLNLQRLDNQECYEIQFSNGIKASYRKGHKLLCRNVHDGSNYWKRVEDIVKDDDYIIVKHCRRFFENLSEGYKGNIYDENFVQCNADDIENVIESRIGIKKVYSGISNKERDLIALMSNSLGYSTYLKEDGSLVVNYLKGSPIPEDLNGGGVSYTKVRSFSKYIDDIIAVECETHEYIDSCLISHNSIIYGASAASFIDPLYKISTMAEAEEFYNNYKSKLPVLFQWIDMKQRQGRRNGTVYTYFGRPRRVKGYFDNGNASFANRTITNTSVQGTAADILKLVMIRLWKNLLNNPEYKDDVRFQCTIHDEIQYSVRASRINEILGLIEDNQTLRLKEWRVPITTEGSLGFSMGGLFAFERIFDNEEKTKWHYVPKLDD